MLWSFEGVNHPKWFNKVNLLCPRSSVKWTYFGRPGYKSFTVQNKSLLFPENKFPGLCTMTGILCLDFSFSLVFN